MQFTSLSIVALLLALLQVALCGPVAMEESEVPHVRVRRDADPVLGHLTAEVSGILNHDQVPMCSCQQLLEEGMTTSGLYRINIGDAGGDFTVFCDMSIQGGGWAIIQRRIGDSIDFKRDFKPYRNGFGEFNGNFWLGLDKIKRMTDTASYELYIGLESFLAAPYDTVWSRYGAFSLGSEAVNFKLTISQYYANSSVPDRMSTHNNQEFSAQDADNDSHSTTDCADVHLGGWWYNSCHDANLNGAWYAGGELPNSEIENGIMWDDWPLSKHSLKTSVMAVRPV